MSNPGREAANQPTASATTSGLDSGSPAAIRGIIGVGALLAGAIAGFLVDEHAEFFKPPSELMERTAGINGVNLPPDLQLEVDQADARVNLHNIRLAYGMIGLTAAAMISVAAGIGHGSLLRSMIGLVAGSAIGGLIGVGAGSLAVALETQLDIAHKVDPTFEAMAIQAAAWSLIAAAVWISFQITVGDQRKKVQSLIGVILMAAVGAALYPVVAAVLFVDRTALSVPEGQGNRLLWALLMNALVAIGLILTMSTRPGTETDLPTPSDQTA